jgi:hypothetical protein
VGKEQRQKDEYIFGPLVEANGFGPRFEGGDGLIEGAGWGNVGFTEGGPEARGGVGDHGLLAAFEEGKVGHSVADVGEVVPEVRAEGGELVFAGEVELTVGGEDAGEDAKVGGDTVGGVGVGCSSEVDGAAAGILLLKILKEFPVVGEVGDVELDSAGEVTFESGSALEEPGGQLEEGQGVVAGERQRGVVQRVGLDEGSVEVDAEDRRRVCVDFRDRKRQNRPFLRLIKILERTRLAFRSFQHGLCARKAPGRPTSLSFILRYLAQ